MDIKQVLLSNYLPYAKGTIVGRAIPSIDGLKPSQRRILFTMYKAGLINGGKTKSSNIVGQVMRYHPHGDMSIYDTMVRLSTGYEGLNVPYVESKGNFGKVYSEDLAYAAPRYTEAKLSPICREVFDGIDEDTVEFIDNFDNTLKEPTLLPVKFPSILVNPSNGIAVGLSSNIPSFSLTNVCNATIGILKGNIKTVDELMDVLGVPEFTTGGYVHADKNTLNNLGETGKGTFTISGSVTTYPDRIVIHEIPYKTTAEAIVSSIEEHVKSGELKEVVDVSDEIDLKGFRLVVMLKGRSNPKAVLSKLCRLTPIRTKVSFNTRVVINNRCEDVGLLSLLNYWIEFRTLTIERLYKYRKKIATSEEHLLKAWEMIKDDIQSVARLIVSKSEAEAKSELMSKYGLDAEQVNYIFDIKIKMFTEDNLAKKMKELNDRRNTISECNIIIGSDDEKHKIIIDDLTRIIKSYGKENKTHQAPIIVEEPEQKEEDQVDDTVVTVILTKSGFLKRLVSLKDIASYELPDGEEEVHRWAAKNSEYLAVFTYDGTVHKILVNSIDAGRGPLKDELYKLIGLPNSDTILFVDTAGDYSKYFNLVYPNGRGTRVYYNKFSGNRKKYKGLFDPCTPGNVWITFADKFFMITQKRKAAYCNLELMGMLSNRVAFKVARVNTGDHILGLQPIEKVPDIERIDLERYSKDYTVCINDDILWETTKKENDDSDSSAAGD